MADTRESTMSATASSCCSASLSSCAAQIWVPERTDLPSIHCLFCSSRPATIARFIITVVIDAVERMFGGKTRAHVGKEQDEIVPSLTDCNPTTAVVGKAFVVWIATTTEHSCPNIIFRNFVRLSVGAGPIPGGLRLEAAARFSAAIAKIAACSTCSLSAITETIPQLIFGVVSQSNQATKSLIGDIDKLWHSGILAEP